MHARTDARKDLRLVVAAIAAALGLLATLAPAVSGIAAGVKLDGKTVVAKAQAKPRSYCPPIC